MTEISFIVRGIAVPQGSSRAFVINGRAVINSKTSKLTAWRDAIATEARKVAPPTLLETPLEVACNFNIMRPKSAKKFVVLVSKRPDIDKLLRAVLDACTGVVWRDDSQVAKITALKMYSDEPGVFIAIRELI